MDHIRNKDVLTILIIILLVSCRNQVDSTCKTNSIGIYTFSKELSKVDISKDSLLLDGLTISLNDDNSFLLSKKIPYLNDSAGTWEVIDELTIEGRYPFIKLHFNNGFQKDISCCCGDSRDISFTSPFYLSEKPATKYGFLSFVKND